MKYCSNCGERLSNSPKFCGECGKGVLQSDNQIIEETNLPVDKTIVDTVAKEDHDTVRLILVDTVVKGLNKSGLIDKKGNWVIQPQFDDVNQFKDGVATASINDKWGLIDKKGNWVIQPLFDSIRNFEDGLAQAEINGKFGFIDKKGNWVIQPIYDIPHDDDVYEWDDDDGPSMKFERRTFDPELYLSTFIDNETTFLGHNNIINHINTKIEYYQKFFYEAFLDYFNEYLLNSLENYIEEKVKISDIKYNFMYYHDEDLLLVFSYKDAIGTFIKADEVGFGYLWESQKGLKVLKEKKRYAIILIFDEEEDEDFDEEFPPQAELRLSRPKSGLFDAPWKFKFTDIVTAMVDARKEYLLLKI